MGFAVAAGVGVVGGVDGCGLALGVEDDPPPDLPRGVVTYVSAGALFSELAAAASWTFGMPALRDNPTPLAGPASALPAVPVEIG